MNLYIDTHSAHLHTASTHACAGTRTPTQQHACTRAHTHIYIYDYFIYIVNSLPGHALTVWLLPIIGHGSSTVRLISMNIQKNKQNSKTMWVYHQAHWQSLSCSKKQIWAFLISLGFHFFSGEVVLGRVYVSNWCLISWRKETRSLKWNLCAYISQLL